MTAGDFEHQNAARWAEYERIVALGEKGGRGVHRVVCVTLCHWWLPLLLHFAS